MRRTKRQQERSSGNAGQKLVTIQKFAKSLDVSVSTARRLAYTGQIATVKVGTRLQVVATEADRFIADNMRRSKTA